MSYGRAIVTVDTTALPDVVGDAGLVVPAGDAPALGDALAQALGDAPLRRRLGDAGRRRAADLFSWDAVASQYEDVLTRAAGRKAEPDPNSLRGRRTLGGVGGHVGAPHDE
jgi:glycosyltransferase involved in cell wall biosynthesis